MPDLSPFSRSRAPATFAGRDLCVSETRHEEKLLLAGDSQVLAPLLEARLLPAPRCEFRLYEPRRDPALAEPAAMAVAYDPGHGQADL